MACYLVAQSPLDTSIEKHHIFYANISENIAHIQAKNKQYTTALSLLDNVIATRLKYPDEVFSTIQALTRILQLQN